MNLSRSVLAERLTPLPSMGTGHRDICFKEKFILSNLNLIHNISYIHFLPQTS